MRILLVEPYYSGSHRTWADGYRAFSGHDVDLVTHEGRFWKWRMQGGFVTLAEGVAEYVGSSGRPDVVLASDMIHLPGLLGACRDDLARVPVALYMHENQLTYPPVPGETQDLTYPVTNWASMAVADLVLFNSEFHRDAWFEELPRLLKHFPDYTHVHRIDDVAAKSIVLPVGVDLARLDAVPSTQGQDPPLVLWNQRWEYDKGPGEFLDAIEALAAGNVPFQVALAGESFATEPGAFEAAAERLGDRVVHLGFAPEARYRELLRAADIVVSTARQEFFGISVVEAMYAGAFPLLPNRLSYPGLLPDRVHARCLYGEDELVDRLRELLLDSTARSAPPEIRLAMARYDWSVLGPRYDATLAGLAGGD